MDRQGLNMKVMALLMTPPSTEDGTRKAAPAAGSSAADRAAELQTTLNQLQNNLREEQRLESEHHHAIFHKILNPVQVQSHPHLRNCPVLDIMKGDGKGEQDELPWREEGEVQHFKGSSMACRERVFVVKAYPQHCDTLAFMHGVNEYHKGRQAADGSAPSTNA